MEIEQTNGAQGASNNPGNTTLNDLFARGPTKVKKATPFQYQDELLVKPEQEKPFMADNLSAAQIKDRERRTVFVGNIPVKTKRKRIKKFFGFYGEVEKVWIRSVPVQESKMPKRAGVITENVRNSGFIDFLVCGGS